MSDPTNGAGYDSIGRPYIWLVAPWGERRVALEQELVHLGALGYVREDQLPIPAPQPGSIAGMLEDLGIRARNDAVDLRQYSTTLGATATSDDTDALELAIADAQATGRRNVIIPTTAYGLGISRRVVFPAGIYPVGSVSVKKNPGQNPGALVRCMTATAGITVGNEDVGLQGGVMGSFTVDGGGVARQPLRFGRIAQMVVLPMQVRNAAQPVSGPTGDLDYAWHRANCAVLLDYIQNSELWLNVSNNGGNGIVVDKGAGGLTLHAESADFGQVAGWAFVCQQSVDGSTTPYPVPQNIVVRGWGGFERGGPNANGVCLFTAAAKVSVEDCFLADGQAGTDNLRPVIRTRLGGNGVCGPIHVGKIVSNGAKNFGTALDVGDGTTLILERASQWRGFRFAFRLGATSRVYTYAGQSWNVDALVDPAGAGTLDGNVSEFTDATLQVQNQTATGTALQSLLANEQAQVTVTGGSTTVVAAAAVFRASHVNTSVKLAAAGAPNPNSATAPRLDLTTKILSVAGDGKSCTVETAPGATGPVWAQFGERWPRWTLAADGTLKLGDGSAAPGATTITPANWAALLALLGGGTASGGKRVKTTDETRTSTTALTADADLVGIPVTNGKVYRFEAFLYTDGDTAGDITLGFVTPGSTSGQFGGVGPAVSLAAGAGNAAAQVSQVVGISQTVSFGEAAGQGKWIRITGSFTVGATGTFGLRWAQATSSAVATAIKTGSWLIVEPLT